MYVQFANNGAIDDDEPGFTPSPEENKEASELLQALRTNKAICYLKLKNYSSAIAEVHICEKIKREFTSWFDLFVYTAQDTFDLAGHCCFGDAGFHPAIKAERHKLTFQHC